MIKVYKDGYSWIAACAVHEDEQITCERWEDALEAAYGHRVFWHKPLRPAWEVTITDGYRSMNVWGIAE